MSIQPNSENFNLEYQINTFDVFLFINNKWVRKLLQLILAVVLYSLASNLTSLSQNFAAIIFTNFLYGFLIYLFFLFIVSYRASMLGSFSNGFTIEDEKIIIHTNKSRLSTDWSLINKGKIKWGKYFYLYYNQSQAYIIPFRAFASKEKVQSFKDLLTLKKKL
ncbi:MAG: YcxB family protein [bacterium]